MTDEEYKTEVASIVGDVALEVWRLCHPDAMLLFESHRDAQQMQNQIRERWFKIATRVFNCKT